MTFQLIGISSYPPPSRPALAARVPRGIDGVGWPRHPETVSATKRNVILTIAGAVLALLGGIVLGFQSSPAALSTDRAEVPNPVAFVSQGGNYRLVLLSQPSGTVGAELACTVYQATGTTVPVDLDTPFTAPAGYTVATCEVVGGISSGETGEGGGSGDAGDGGDAGVRGDTVNYVYAVVPVVPAVAIAATVALVVGLLALAAGFVLLIVDHRSSASGGRRAAVRAPARPAPEPPSAAAPAPAPAPADD